nr:type IV pilus biogenesis/stability protein PilW [Polaromonas sp. JS666]
MSGPSGNRSDIVTESDEPDHRRRARLRLELATGYFEQGQPNVALDEIKQSLAIDPTFVDAYNVRGLVYMRLNDIPLAEDSFRRALALNPRDGDVAHNYGWLLCQQARYEDSFRSFAQAVANPTYGGKAKTLMAQGVCQVRAGQRAEAEQSLMQSYELDAGNPVTGYNLATLLYERGDLTRAQFYIRRLNNSELANAETLWLGIKTERKLNNREAVLQLADQLKKRFAQSPQAAAYEKGAFNE